MPDPTIECGSPPDGKVGIVYEYDLPNSHTGSVAITGGSLPPGLAMDGAGLISGTPTTAGTFPFSATITVPSGLPRFGTLSNYLGTTFINESDGALRAYGDSDPGVTRLSVIRWRLTVENGPVTWALLGGPITPVSSDSVSYTFDFSPVVEGDFSFTLQATNSLGSTAKTFTIGVGLYPSSLSNGVIGPLDQFVLLAGGGERVIGPAFIGDSLLPDGWSNPFAAGIIEQLSSSGGSGHTPNRAININTGPSNIGYGVVAPGTYNIPVILDNSGTLPHHHAVLTVTILATRPPPDDSGTASVDCSITITAPAPPSLGLGCASPPDGVVGVPYLHAFPVSGGTPPYTFAIISGTLPPGLTLDSLTGEVSGRPTLAGDFEFVIRVSDGFGSTMGTCDIVITVTEQPGSGIDCGSPPPGKVGVAYDHTFPVTGIPPGATVSYSITGGSLPPGLTLNPATGEVTGTPTTEGHYGFTITLTVSEPDLDVLTDAAGAIIYTTVGDTITVTHGIGGL